MITQEPEAKSRDIAKPVVALKKLPLSPKVHPTIARFIEQKSTLQQLVKALGSPLNILFPELVHDNVQNFRKAFTNVSSPNS